MRAEVLYFHSAPGLASLTLRREDTQDVPYVCFYPEVDETLPFPDGINMIPFNKFAEWFNQMAALQADNDDLTQLIADTVDAQYSADMEVLSNV